MPDAVDFLRFFPLPPQGFFILIWNHRLHPTAHLSEPVLISKNQCEAASTQDCLVDYECPDSGLKSPNPSPASSPISDILKGYLVLLFILAPALCPPGSWDHW